MRHRADLPNPLSRMRAPRFTRRARTATTFLLAIVAAAAVVAGPAAASAAHRVDLAAASARAEGFVPYFAFDPDTVAHLDLANRAPEAITVHLTALVAGRHPVDLGAVELPAEQVVRVPIHDRLRAEGAGRVAQGTLLREGAVWGALLVDGDTDRFSAWLLMENRRKSLSLNTMMVRRGQGATAAFAQWWRPTPATVVDVVAQNVGDLPTSVQVRARVDGTTFATRSRSLASGESARFSLDALMEEWGLARLPDAGMLELRAADGGMIAARTYAYDAEVGFSSPLMTHDVAARMGFELQTPGVPLGTVAEAAGFAPGTTFHPMLLVSNTSEAAVKADIHLQGELFPDAEPEYRPIESPGANDARGDFLALLEQQSFEVLPAKTWGEVFAVSADLDPGETRVVDLLELAADLALEVGEIGVRVDARGSSRPGAVVADLISVDQTLTYSFYDPMFDTAIPRTSRTEVSFELTGSKTAHLLFKNASLEENAGAQVRIHYTAPSGEPGTYDLFRRLAPMELWRIDIEHLRDARIPDPAGRLLPADLTYGFATAATSPSVLGANPTFDPVVGTCGSCETENPPNCERFRRVPFTACWILTNENVEIEPSNGLCPGASIWGRACFYAKTYPCGQSFNHFENSVHCSAPPPCPGHLTNDATKGEYTRSCDVCGSTPPFCQNCLAESTTTCITASP